MSDEVFEIGFETSGEEEAAAAFTKLKLKQAELQREARGLNARLRELSEAGQSNTTEFQELSRSYVALRGQAADLGRAARGLNRDLQNQAQATQRVEAAVTATNVSVEAGGRRFGELAGALGNTFTVLGQNNTAFGQAGALVGAMGTATTALTTSMGPLGVAIAAVTVAGGLLLPMLSDAEDELESVDTAAQGAAASIRDLANAFRERNESQRLRAGLDVSADDFAGAIGMQRDAVAELEAQRNRAVATVEDALPVIGLSLEAFRESARRDTIGITGAAADAARSLDDLDARIREERTGLAELEAAAARNLNSEGGVGRAGPGAIEGFDSERAQRQAEERQRESTRRRAGHRRQARREEMSEEEQFQQLLLQNEITAAQERAAAAAQANEFMLNAEREWHERRIALVREAEDRKLELFNQTATHHNSLIESNREKEKGEALARQEEAAAQASFIQDQFSQLGGNVTNLVGDMVRHVAKGEELTGDAFTSMLDAFLESTAIEYGIRALSEAALAVAAAARYDGAAAAQHATAAALSAGVAAATGIGAAAIPNTPAVGGGGAPPAPGQFAPEGGGRGGSPVTINIFAPNAVMTEAEQGQIINRLSEAARREYGE